MLPPQKASSTRNYLGWKTKFILRHKGILKDLLLYKGIPLWQMGVQSFIRSSIETQGVI